MDATADPPRKRGGQPGNANAVRHGLFRRAKLTQHQLDLLEDSRAEGGVADIVAMLRVEIVRLIESGAYKHEVLAALAKALFIGALAEHKLTGGDDKRDAMAALDAVLADVRQAEEARDAARP